MLRSHGGIIIARPASFPPGQPVRYPHAIIKISAFPDQFPLQRYCHRFCPAGRFQLR
jgi:hypothetical protein